ncbi:hypothetical protein [Streptomyces sp. NBC_00691]|uniref:hypothetical protein n=1 Tax=Streptomyces sp. NBC_00691 TaxID=2903671 RepID=UPI002E37A0EE|nr:hypothetical protein [Streptomyces sp. NBC_00691]
MARTAHHIPRSRRRPAAEKTPGAPWRSLVLYDLRHASARRAGTGADREHPHPRTIRRLVVFRRWPRFNQDSGVARWSAQEERRARRRLRAQVGRVLSAVNAPDGTVTPDAADTVDIPPARHRHSSLWFA